MINRTRFWSEPTSVPWPFTSHSPRHPGMQYVGGDGQVHAYMTPGEFITATGVPDEYVKIRIDPAATRLAEKMRDGLTNMPYLNIERDPRTGIIRVAGHEGRHRARAAKLLGLSMIPVILVFRAPDNGSKWAEWSDGKVEDYPPVTALLAGKTIVVRPQRYGREFEKGWGFTPLARMKLKLR